MLKYVSKKSMGPGDVYLHEKGLTFVARCPALSLICFFFVSIFTLL